LVDLNKEMKQGKINVYPLDWVQDKRNNTSHTSILTTSFMGHKLILLKEFIQPKKIPNINK